MKQVNLEQVFEALHIQCEKVAHPPLETCLDADTLLVDRPGTRLKNLFLRDNYGRRHFLLLTQHDKQVDLKALSKTMQLSRLGFASNERLAKYLGVKPGCVSLLALLNDDDNAVELWIDEAIWQGDLFHCHPFDNTKTWLIAKADAIKLLEHSQHTWQVLTVPSRVA